MRLHTEQGALLRVFSAVHKIHPATEIEVASSNTETRLVDPTTIRKNMCEGAFLAKFAVALLKVFAGCYFGSRIGGMAERTSLTSLTGALTEELAWNMAGVYQMKPRVSQRAYHERAGERSFAYSYLEGYALLQKDLRSAFLLQHYCCHDFEGQREPVEGRCRLRCCQQAVESLRTVVAADARHR